MKLINSAMISRPLLGVLVACSMLVFLMIVLPGVRPRAWWLDDSSSKEGSCLSRYQSASYWKVSDHKPSYYLLQKLRSYEALHKKCGPNSAFFKNAVEQLKDFDQLKSNHSEKLMDCNYLIWIPDSGLGNRMISITSAFLYALLSNKVLLLLVPDDLKGLFCEPFPESSWVLPSNFPLQNLQGYYKGHTPQNYGTLLWNKILAVDNDTTNTTLPFIYVHIMHDSDNMDKMFCDGAQNFLRKIQWVFIRANNYYAPGFFLIPQYHEELDHLFPEKDTVFHHLARYLLHPTNSVWAYIRRYYDDYLANAKVRLGIQIRNLPFASASFEDRLAQIVNCTMKEGLLPNVIDLDEPLARSNGSREALKAVLVVSLNLGYYDSIKRMYYEHATATGESIAVYQPSHEEEQHTERQGHNVKALAEMYLLSFCEFLVTSEQSTFGYVANGLSGLKPWIVQVPNGDRPSCRKSTSMEPCFMDPPSCDCKEQSIDTAAIHPYLRRCEDVERGLKLFSN